MSYAKFLAAKSQLGTMSGFDPNWVPDFLYDFQRHLVEWSVLKGRSAIFADCGMGKTPMQLVWAENVCRHAGRPVLLLTPLAVSQQTVREAEKFGIDCRRVSDGAIPTGARVVVTNYERLHHFSPHDVAGMVCDESSILKNFDGARRGIVQEFLRTLPYRLLCTATAAPNDYIELGTSSEALGELGHMDMLGRFFKNDQNSLHPTSGRGRWELGTHTRGNKWRFKHHAEQPFWRWVCSWARAMRRPSIDHQAVARVLAQLGKVGSNVNQIAHHANAGRPLDRMSNSLDLALRDLAELRLACLQALGHEPGGPAQSD